MATLQTINYGVIPGDSTADPLRDAFIKSVNNDVALNAGLMTNKRPRMVQVCNRCVNPSSPLTTFGDEGQCRLFHRAGAAGYTGIQFLYTNRSNAASNITDNLTNLGTLTVKAALDYNSIIYPITFNNGAATVALLPGASIWSDPIGVYIAPNATFFERVLALCPAGSFVRSSVVTASRSEGHEIGVGLVDKVYSGVFTFTSNNSVYSAVAIRGWPVNKNYGSVVVLMDSLASGVGSANASEDRGFADKAFSNLYGVCNVAVSGGTLSGWNSQGDARWRRQIINDLQPSLLVAGCGGNDLNNVGVTAATVISRLQAFWTQLKVYGCPIIAWTIPPRTTSTDSWATYANQTINSPNANWEVERLTLNTYLRNDAVNDGYVAQVVDYAAIVEEGGVNQTGRWKSDGVTANLYTSDGAHANDTGSVNAQQLIADQVDVTLADAYNLNQ